MEKELNKVVNNSYNIFLLYKKLSYAEMKYGINSEEYKKIASYIEILQEEENNYFELIFKNRKTLSSFKMLCDETFCSKTLNPFQNFYCTMESGAESKSCLKRVISRVQSDIDLRFEENNLLKNLDLNILKNYVLLLDGYINESKDKKVKYKLIKEKNNIISSNKTLEGWYLGFKKKSIKCLVIDSDIIQAYLLGYELEDYITFKEDYLSVFCNSIINHVLLSYVSSFDKLKCEIRLLAVLMEMDSFTLDVNYRDYKDLENKDGYQNGDFKFVDSVFAKCPELIKKKNNFNL